MTRTVLSDERVHPTVRDAIASFHSAVLQEVIAAVATHPAVVVGMSGNAFCTRARRSLEGAGVAPHYLEYGSYFSGWKLRLALKMWAGWPTFPMVFVRGQFVGGAQDVDRLIASGELARLLAA